MPTIGMSFCLRIASCDHSCHIMRLLALLYALGAIPSVVRTDESRFDNSVIGVPVILCERDHIIVKIATSRPFAGKVFVKGEYSNRKCMQAYVNGFPSSSDDVLLSQTIRRPSHPNEKLEDNGIGLNNSSESDGDYLDSAEILPSPEQAGRFLTESDLQVSNREKPVESYQGGKAGSAREPSSSKWSGYGGVSSHKYHGQPYVGAFGGSRREEIPSTITPTLKIYRKSKEDFAGEIPSYPGPQGLTAENCPVKCEPCVCAKEKMQERRRRDTNPVELTVPLGACNMKRDRKLSPPTLLVSFVTVISFHDSFITKLDRAYRIQCAYTETNRSLSTQLDVGTMASSQLNGTASPPVCTYHITGANGQEIQNVRVGELVKHEWICSTSAPKLYSMLIHSCYVEDGAGQRYQVIDENGCSLDHYILNTPHYAPDGLTATVDALMMKFPDKSTVDFQCSIQVCSKLDQNCTATTPPDCSSSDMLVRRRRRAATIEKESLTIHANSLTVLDADATQDLPHTLALTAEPWLPSEFCLSIAGFGILVSASTFVATIAVGIAAANIYVRVQSSKW